MNHTETVVAQNDPRTMTAGFLIGSLALARKDFAVRELLRRYDEDVDGFRTAIDDYDRVLANPPTPAPTPSTPTPQSSQWFKDQETWLNEQDSKPPTLEPMGPLMVQIARSGWNMTGMRYRPDQVRAFVENDGLHSKSEALLTVGQRRLWRTIKHYYSNFCRYGNF